MSTPLWDHVKLFGQRKHKIRFTILSVFLGLSVFATLLTSAYTYLQMENIIQITSRELIDKTQKVIINDTMDYLNPARFIPMISAGLMQKEQEITESQELVDFLLESLDEFPQIDAFYNGDEKGNALIVGRIGLRRMYAFSDTQPLPDQALYMVRKIKNTPPLSQESRSYFDGKGQQVAQEINPITHSNFDPRGRPWYQKTKNLGSRNWTDVYLYESSDLGLTFAVPVVGSDGKLTKVMSADITVNKISDLLLRQKASRSGINFIVTPEGTLVGYPDVSKIVLTLNRQPQIAQLEQVGEPSLTTAYNLYQKTHESHLFFTYQNIDYIAHFTPFPQSSGKNWILGMVVPADDFIGPIKQTSREVLIISFLVLLVASVILVIFSHKISDPIEQMAAQMLKIRTLEIEEESPLNSNLQEFAQMDSALQAMKEGLNSFSKFVPKSLVQRLIASGQEAKMGGERKRLTFLFSDIEGFTTISEKMPSEILINHLSEYLSELSTIVLRQQGTIDKYIGDSIMAFWGAPERDEHQVLHACQAVWLCHRRLEELNQKWIKQGKPPLPTRFGLHQGEAVVGNVGSADRLNYTVIGDNVNLSSRLEGINKIYGTHVIASEKVYEKAKDKFLFRFLDIVAVKGKEKGIKIYEMVGKLQGNADEIVTPQQIEEAANIQQAFNSYLKGHWDEAEKFYTTLLQENPQHPLATLYLERITAFKLNPPPANWEGIYHLKVK